MCMAPNMPNQGGYWYTAVPGMTQNEVNSLPSLNNITVDADGGLAELKRQRDAAMEKWKTDNPERYQQGLRDQEQAASGQQTRTQAAQTARRGAGGTAGGGSASSIDTLLTSGTTQGVDPSALDLSKNTLLGL